MTTTPTAQDTEDSTDRPTLRRAVSAAAHRLAAQLNGSDHGQSARARAALSRLRRGTAQEPSEEPLTWGLVVDEILVDLPEQAVGRGYGPSDSEWAAYTSLALFALHQQSISRPMHVTGINLGHAVGRLRRATESGSIKARLDALLTATTPLSIRYHLRSLVSLLNAHQIALDYGLLAEDLRRLRGSRTAGPVRVSWARGFVQGARGPSEDQSNPSHRPQEF